MRYRKSLGIIIMNENKEMDPLIEAYPFINGVLYNLSKRRLDSEHYRKLEEIQELKEMRVNAECDKILTEQTIENIEVLSLLMDK